MEGRRPHGLQPTRLLCPWDSPGKHTGVGCHFLLQGIFPTQRSNLHLLPWWADSLPRGHLGRPFWAAQEAEVDHEAKDTIGKRQEPHLNPCLDLCRKCRDGQRGNVPPCCETLAQFRKQETEGKEEPEVRGGRGTEGTASEGQGRGTRKEGANTLLSGIARHTDELPEKEQMKPSHRLSETLCVLSLLKLASSLQPARPGGLPPSQPRDRGGKPHGQQ